MKNKNNKNYYNTNLSHVTDKQCSTLLSIETKSSSILDLVKMHFCSLHSDNLSNQISECDIFSLFQVRWPKDLNTLKFSKFSKELKQKAIFAKTVLSDWYKRLWNDKILLQSPSLEIEQLSLNFSVFIITANTVSWIFCLCELSWKDKYDYAILD